MEYLLLKSYKKPGAFHFSLAIMLGFILILAGCSSMFIYYPEKKIMRTPADMDLAYESVYIKTVDKIRLSGWWLPVTDARGVVLFLYGNGGNISYYLDILSVFGKLSLNTLMIDYRGYGMSEGHPNEEGTYNDAQAAWDFLIREKNIPPDKIIVIGRSLGGAIAGWLASHNTPKLLILESSFLSFAKVAKDLYPWAPTTMLFGNIYNTAAHLEKTRCPVLVIHSPDDEITPFEHGLKLFEIAREPKEFLKISGSHNSGFYQSLEIYKEGLNDFITRYLGPQLPMR